MKRAPLKNQASQLIRSDEAPATPLGLSAAGFHLALSALSHRRAAGSALLLSGMVAGCASNTTPPQSSPVYAEEIAPEAEPATIERRSVDKPEVESIASAQEPTAAEQTGVENGPEPAPASEQASSDADKSEAKADKPAAATKKPVAAKPAPATASQPAPKTVKKSAPSGAEAGCGAGTCG